MKCNVTKRPTILFMNLFINFQKLENSNKKKKKNSNTGHYGTTTNRDITVSPRLHSKFILNTFPRDDFPSPKAYIYKRHMRLMYGGNLKLFLIVKRGLWFVFHKDTELVSKGL